MKEYARGKGEASSPEIDPGPIWGLLAYEANTLLTELPCQWVYVKRTLEKIHNQEWDSTKKEQCYYLFVN